jgi:hypothetical protein
MGSFILFTIAVMARAICAAAHKVAALPIAT